MTVSILGFESFCDLLFEDPYFANIMANLGVAENNVFLLMDGFLFHNNQLCILESSLRVKIIKELHGEGHVGRDRTLQLVRDSDFWPTIWREVERGEGDAEIGEEAQFDEEDVEANIGVEPIFDEEESDEEESEPSLFYDETCLSMEVFADLDLPPVFDEEVFDKESMIADLDLPPVFDEEIFDKESMSADFDPKPELVEEECHAAKVDKEASLGIGDQSAPKFNNIGVVDSGNTAEEHGSAMVVRVNLSSMRQRLIIVTDSTILQVRPYNLENMSFLIDIFNIVIYLIEHNGSRGVGTNITPEPKVRMAIELIGLIGLEHYVKQWNFSLDT
ncbi:hypothetical protein LWI29_018207 [Acer saccharum]|uniref:Integrase zinc-binding domain-containing protein n=1 Tax=Acer saccharum TaxID=4024 RepID=A0AA39VZD6_ACESA|nr:hypothetical protein LWI29_018207 [Acer saccharum]